MLKNEVVISGRAWLPKSIFTKARLKALRKDLTIRLKPSSYDDGPTVVEMFEETDFHIGLPRGFYERTSRGRVEPVYDLTERERQLIPAVFPRDEVQEEGVKVLTAELRSRRARGAILCAATGIGKTVMGLFIASELRQATLVVVHTKILMDQWVERIKVKPGVFPDAKVGIFQGEREEFGPDYDIVVAMVHSLSNRPVDHPIFSWPGLVIVDETHRMGAPSWNKVAHHFNAAKRLGLTATPRRRDGGERLFFDTIGDVAWSANVPMLIPKVRQERTSFELKDVAIPSYVEDRLIVHDQARNQHIVREVYRARKAGRTILLLTKRVNHILLLKRLIEKQVPDSTVGVCVGGWYLDEAEAYESLTTSKAKYQGKFKSGGKYDLEKIDMKKFQVERKPSREEVVRFNLDGEDAEPSDPPQETRQAKGDIKMVKPRKRNPKPEEFKEAVTKDIILATYKMVSEGFDVPHLDTLFLAMPIWDPVQATGRILRYHPGKKVPIVTHFIDDKVPKLRAAWQRCRKHYQDLGVEI